ncbi:hypothetical protein DVH05_025667 [Phytophthora capsici]|nr:hypothetical protein DVH05_025667 [Phytophthora capsici]
MEAYVEAAISTSIGDETHGDLDGIPAKTPYSIVFRFDKKRQMYKSMSNCVNVYDFVELIEDNLLRQWRQSAYLVVANPAYLVVANPAYLVVANPAYLVVANPAYLVVANPAYLVVANPEPVDG